MIASFKTRACASAPSFAKFHEADWTSVMWWLDASGMAIYFFDRVGQIGADTALPPLVLETLALRMENNRLRMRSLLQEAHALAESFAGMGIPYALLKGFSLAPDAVPDIALRSQIDLDFLVSRGDVKIATHCIEQMGYKHFADSGNTIEFHAGTPSRPDMANIYSALTQRALELHLLPESESESNLLTRRVSRSFSGFSMSALSPADIMVQQALHLLKHLCGEHTKLSWVLEFWRHAAARREDWHFWSLVGERAKETMNGDLAMSIAFWAADEFFGLNDVVLREQWTAEAMPFRVRLWLERYARQLLISDLTGSKLYALLRKEIPNAAGEERKTRDILLPRVLPFRILEPRAQESFADRLDRYAVELKFFIRRLGFHIRESVRLVFETARWSRATAKVER